VVLAFIITLLLCVMLGIPVAFSLAVAGMVIAFLVGNLSLDAFLVLMSQRMFVGSEQFVLLAIPLFIFSGELMSRGGVTERIIDFASAIVGWIRGGLAMITIVAEVFFSGISGSAVADVAALGSLLIPAMKNRGYNKNFASALMASAGVLGPIIPPSIMMVVYGMLANVSVAKLFIGGMVPGIIGAGLMMAYSYYAATKYNFPREAGLTMAEIKIRILRAILPLGMPVIIMGGILGGAFTPTEAAAVACLYGYIVSKLVYKKLSFRELIDSSFNSALDTAKVMFILATSNFITFLMARGQIPQQIAEYMLSLTSSPYVTLLLINILLLIVGCFLEASCALIILTPILLSITVPLGIDPILLGVMACVNLSIGTITPPVGLSLYVAMGIGGTSLEKISRAALPFVFVLILMLFIITYIPELVLFLPRILM
jgi:C4-dicarboxylate transporter, DctM subunit